MHRHTTSGGSLRLLDHAHGGIDFFAA
jgi:hypothetical protein